MAALSLTAPVIDDERFKREQLSMTEEEKLLQIKDVYGIVSCHGTQHEMDEFEKQLGLLESKASYDMAQEQHPHLVKDDDKVLFLRADDGDSKLAAERIVRYWEERIIVFQDRAFQSIASIELSEEMLDGTDSEIVRVLDGKDKWGCPLIFVDWSKFYLGNYTLIGLRKLLWVRVHQALDATEPKERGRISVILDASGFGIKTFSRTLVKRILKDMNNLLPVRRITHVCNPSKFFHDLYPQLRFLMGKKVRSRVFLHSEQIDHLLEMYGIPGSCLPEQILPENARPRKRRGLRFGERAIRQAGAA